MRRMSLVDLLIYEQKAPLWPSCRASSLLVQKVAVGSFRILHRLLIIQEPQGSVKAGVHEDVNYLTAFAPHLFHNKAAGQSNERKYIGVILSVNGMDYFAPLISQEVTTPHQVCC